MSKLTNDLICKLNKLTDEQIELMSIYLDKITLEQAIKWAPVERILIGESCYNCAFKSDCYLFRAMIDEAFNADTVPHKLWCKSYTKEE